MRLFLLSSLGLLFVACGGGGDDAAAPPVDGTSSSSSSSSSSSGGASSSSGGSTSSSGGDPDGGTDANVTPPDTRIDTSKPSASDTRLKQRIRKTAQGAETFLGWRDTQLNQDCAFKAASDGELRCLPTDVASRGAFYIDASCTQAAIAQQKNACTQSAYATDEDRTVCPTRTKLHALGTALTDGATYYYQAYPGAACEARVAGAVGTYIYPLGAEVPATDFVKATIATKTSGVAGIDLQELTADDGAKGFWSFEDSAKTKACGFLRASDSSMRCLPTTRGFATIGTYYDSGCTTPLNLATDGEPASCAAPAFAAQLASDKYTTYAVGAAHPAPISMKFFDSSCGAIDTASAGMRVYDLGAEQQPTTFPLATEMDSAPKGNLVEKLLDVGGKVKQTAAFYDSTLATKCSMSPYAATDGSLRCIPEHTFAIISTYSATCNGPKLVHTYMPGTPKFAQDTLSQNTMCPPRRRVVRVGNAYSGQLYVNGCTYLTKPSEVYATGIHFFQQGTEVLPADMVAVTEELR